MKILLSILLGCFFHNTFNAQNYVGMHKNEIKMEMKTNYPQFRQDLSTVTSKTRSVKYIDKSGDNTVIFYLDKNDHCTFSTLFMEKKLIPAKKQELNEKYQSVNENCWVSFRDDETYLIKLEEKDWFATITIVQKKD